MAKHNIFISKNQYFNNSNLLLPSIKDSKGNLLETQIVDWLTQEYELKAKKHTNKGVTRDGFDANDLNAVLRDKMISISGIHGESYVENGTFLKSGKKGFDFAVFDEEYNIIKLRNNYIGDPGRYNGEAKLLKLYKKVITSSSDSYKKREWEKKIQSLDGENGVNITSKKERYTVVGELQFGNWALAEHDLLRLLNSSTDGEIDLYVYITPTGNLESCLSQGIVSYDKVNNLYRENKQLLRIPIWLIGIDIKS